MNLSVLFGLLIILFIIKLVVKSVKIFLGAALGIILISLGITLMNSELGTDITIIKSINAALASIGSVASGIWAWITELFN